MLAPAAWLVLRNISGITLPFFLLSWLQISPVARGLFLRLLDICLKILLRYVLCLSRQSSSMVDLFSCAETNALDRCGEGECVYFARNQKGSRSYVPLIAWQ